MPKFIDSYDGGSAGELLLDIPLSAEAKAIAAQVYALDFAPAVTTCFSLHGDPEVTPDAVRRVVQAAWGAEVARSIAIVGGIGDDLPATLRSVQDLVHAQECLFAVAVATMNDRNVYVLCVNHVLADEAALALFGNMLGDACRNGMAAGLARMTAARESYLDYIAAQKNHVGEVVTEDVAGCAPLSLCATGALGWSADYPRVVLHKRLVDCGATLRETIRSFLCALHNSGAVRAGSVIGSSRNWRGTAHRDAIGMMTGLVPLFCPPERADRPEITAALEAHRRDDTAAAQLMRGCRETEVFLNGAEPRGISGVDVRNPTFPVGIDVRGPGDGDLLFEVEGCFRDPKAASDFLDQFAILATQGSMQRDTIH